MGEVAVLAQGMGWRQEAGGMVSAHSRVASKRGGCPAVRHLGPGGRGCRGTMGKGAVPRRPTWQRQRRLDSVGLLRERFHTAGDRREV